MKVYTYSEARQNFARVLAEAERDGGVTIRRRDGAMFVIRPESSTQSPLDVPGVALGIGTKEWVASVRKGRERSG